MPDVLSNRHPYVIQVEGEQHRVRIPADAKLLAPWLLGGGPPKIECVGAIGAEGGLVIAPDWAVLRSLRDTINGIKGPLPEDLRHEVEDVERFLALTWDLEFRVYADRFDLKLPRQARRAGVVPSTGELATVYVSSRSFEVWRHEDWLTHGRHLARDVRTRGADIRSRLRLAAEEAETSPQSPSGD